MSYIQSQPWISLGFRSYPCFTGRWVALGRASQGEVYAPGFRHRSVCPDARPVAWSSVPSLGGGNRVFGLLRIRILRFRELFESPILSETPKTMGLGSGFRV